ncbi:hypothetical protein GOP47_0005650 [Adiantum capillus-veneris]|uniref:Pentatricopeptide repeat-containing protein n=1 Tax=Adiantum capillus-veneris TaxID=13818 RepID=A0A9D4ZNR1_ADICA|nr:hypothetical protein GOP47_0005650 [Adiantum capillus-veneris]
MSLASCSTLKLHKLVSSRQSQLSSLLQDCIRSVDVQAGRCLHERILRESLELQPSLGSQLIRLYALGGCLPDANYVFTQISKPNVYACSTIISANAKLGQSADAINLYCKMQEMPLNTDSYVLVATLRACAEDSIFFKEGKILHHHAIELNAHLDAYVISSLIGFYASGGALDDSYIIFSRLIRPDRVQWGIMIGAYSQHGHGLQALYLYKKMQEGGMDVDEVIFLCALKACCNVGSTEDLGILHTHTALYGLENDISLGNALVDAYAKCGNIKEAHNVFMALPRRDVVTWGAIIEGYAQHGLAESALHLFQEMQEENVDTDGVVVMSCLKACSHSSTLNDGKLIHFYILMNNFELDLQVGCSVVDMYAKCGSIDDAFTSFQKLPRRNVVTSNTIISAFLQHGRSQEAACLFQQMLHQHIIPNELTFVFLVKVCSDMMDLCLGRIVHTFIIEYNAELGVLAINTLIDMYAKCGNLNDAHFLFDRSSKQDVVSWGVLISGFVQHGRCEEGCKYFWQMLGEGLEADEAACLGGLKACTGMGDLGLGRLVHAEIIGRKGEYETSIGNSLIDFYGKCGSFKDAYAVFADLKKRDKVSYNAMIAACAHHSQFQKSLHLFGEMVEGGMSPTQVTLACAISACTNIVAINYGKLIHNLFVEMGLQEDLYVTNALVAMYGKCGSPEAALKVFNDSSHRDTVTWNAIISGCAQHSLYKHAKICFEHMCKAGVKPDGVTFLCLLSSCAHAGSVEEGQRLFKSMKRDYGLTPTPDHYSCMLDLLGRAGCIEEAADFHDCTPCETSVEGQTSLLSHCKEKGFVEVGNLCFNQLMDLKDQDT